MSAFLNTQTKSSASRLGDGSKGLAASSLALTKPTPQPKGKTTSASADKPVRLDRTAWASKAKSIGKSTRAQTTAELQEVILPAMLPKVRREVHTAISQFQKSPSDLMELLFEDVTLARTVLAGAQFDRHNPMEHPLGLKKDKPPVNLPAHLKNDVLSAAVRRVKLEKICEALDDAEMDASPLTAVNKPWLLKWWRHAVAVSQLSGTLAPAMHVEPDLARMAGFFHDIGRLMFLSSRLGPKVIAAYEYTPQMDISTAYAEHVLLGMDHHQAGAAFCTRWKLPLAIHNICGQHDLDDTMRQQFDTQTSRLSAVVSAADEIAKASGIGSLPDDEIRPLPQCMQNPCAKLSTRIDETLAQIQTMCSWRTEHTGVEPLPKHLNLKGKLVAFVSPSAGPWNPLARLLARAGAQVSTFTDLKQVTLNCPMSDLMLLDFTDSSLHLAMPVLSRLAKAQCFANIPKLLLASATEEPQSRIKQAGLSVSVMPTPIRCLSMLGRVKQLMD